jgi:hypothetical protein
MVTTGANLSVSAALALFIGAIWKPSVIGWLLAGEGVLFLAHAAVTVAIIWANNNVVPAYVNYWSLFATIPIGVLLVVMGFGIVCVRSCLGWLRARRLERVSDSASPQ